MSASADTLDEVNLDTPSASVEPTITTVHGGGADDGNEATGGDVEETVSKTEALTVDDGASTKEAAESNTAATEEAPAESSSIAVATENDSLDAEDSRAQSSSTTEAIPPKKKKSVGFSKEPNQELWEHHSDLQKKEKERAKSNAFQKIPPELVYLERRNNPGPQPLEKPKPKLHSSMATTGNLGDLRDMPVKELAVQNKTTEYTFQHTSVWLPVSKNRVLVDVRYVSVQSIDLAKVNRFGMNLSETKIGIGYEFAGIVSHLGTINEYEYKVGDRVYGIINSDDHKGALTSSLLVSLSRDTLVVIDDEMWNKMAETCINLDFTKPEAEFEIDSEEEVKENESITTSGSGSTKFFKKKSNPYALDQVNYPPLAKFSAISEQYCRAKSVLSHLKVTTQAAILINGGDTILAQSILQVLFAEFESLARVNIILVVGDRQKEKTEAFVENLKQMYYDPAKTLTISIVTYDSVPESIVPNKPTPKELSTIYYKKLDFFAVEVIEKLFANHNARIGPPVSAQTLKEWQLDMIIDIIGSKKYFQHTVAFDKMDEIQFPVHEHLAGPLQEVFTSKDKQQFFLKLLKPKKYGSSFVSMCEWNVKEPSYMVDKLLPFKENNSGIGSKLFNVVSSYNFYDETILKAKPEWLVAAYQLVVDEKLKFDIAAILDWRDNIKQYITDLKRHDRKVILQVESI